ncbi:hypothetical protein Droror1_Dr00012731 [Drosera rotundifolia]
MIVTIEVVVKIQWWSRLAVSRILPQPSSTTPRHHSNPNGNPDIIRETPAETPTSSDSNHSSISFSGNPDIIRESQRRRCANVAIVDEIIALALDLALVLVAAAVTSSASPTTAAAAKTLSTKTTQRGLNKPKCIKCSNVARSRCPYQSCKSCCSKAQNPCHIHGKGNTVGKELSVDNANLDQIDA